MKKKLFTYILFPALLLLTAVLCIQCDGMELFPSFLTGVSYIKDLGTDFEMFNNSFDVVVIASNGKEFIYVIQNLDDGNKTAVCLDNFFEHQFTYTSPYFGTRHGRAADTANSFTHMLGTAQIYYDWSTSTLNVFDFFFGIPNDVFSDTGGSNGLRLLTGYFSATEPQIRYYPDLFANAIGTEFTVTISPGLVPGHNYIPELGIFSGGGYSLLISDKDTHEGFFITDIIGAYKVRPIGKIVPGRAKLGCSVNGEVGSVIVEHLDGKFIEYYVDISNVYAYDHGKGGDNLTSQFRGYEIAYGRDYMYLFNISSRRLYKARKWWDN